METQESRGLSSAEVEAELRRALQREEVMGRIRDQIIGMRHPSEFARHLDKDWVEELRGLGLPIAKAMTVQLPGSREGYFADYHFLVSGEAHAGEFPLAQYPWIEAVWESGQPAVVGWKELQKAGFPPEIRSLVELPLPGGGSLGVNSQEEAAFDEAALHTLQIFAGLVAEGIRRLQDFEALQAERQQAEERLQLDLALERVRNQVLQMQGEEDWQEIVEVVVRELKALLEFNACSIDLVDFQRQTSTVYYQNTRGARLSMYPGLAPALVQAVESRKCVYRRNQAEMRQWGDSPELFELGVNSVLDVPFSGGTVAINSTAENAFGEREIRLLEQFAQVMTMAHRRLQDLKALQLHEELLRQSQRLEAIGQLAAGVAHEINNPLTAVIGYAQLLLRQEQDPEKRESLETIRQEGERARQIASRLLNFALRQQTERQAVELNPLVQEVLALSRWQLMLNGIVLREELEEGLPLVDAHPGQLQQVALALLRNSHEAFQRSGMGKTVRVQTSAREGWVQLIVEDDGPGIPAALREQIFEPSFTTKKEGKGAGLSLHLCRRIAQDHGGRLWAEPRDQGACLILELPALAGRK